MIIAWDVCSYCLLLERKYSIYFVFIHIHVKRHHIPKIDPAALLNRGRQSCHLTSPDTPCILKYTYLLTSAAHRLKSGISTKTSFDPEGHFMVNFLLSRIIDLCSPPPSRQLHKHKISPLLSGTRHFGSPAGIIIMCSDVRGYISHPSSSRRQMSDVGMGKQEGKSRRKREWALSRFVKTEGRLVLI